MNSEQAVRAVSLFLDQFISRGASANVVGLRDRLSESPEERSKVAALFPSTTPSPDEAFGAMRVWFSSQLDRGEPDSGYPDLADLCSWTTVEPDGVTSDPAQWEDWVACVATATSP